MGKAGRLPLLWRACFSFSLSQTLIISTVLVTKDNKCFCFDRHFFEIMFLPHILCSLFFERGSLVLNVGHSRNNFIWAGYFSCQIINFFLLVVAEVAMTSSLNSPSASALTMKNSGLPVFIIWICKTVINSKWFLSGNIFLYRLIQQFCMFYLIKMNPIW